MSWAIFRYFPVECFELSYLIYLQVAIGALKGLGHIVRVIILECTGS